MHVCNLQGISTCSKTSEVVTTNLYSHNEIGATN